MFRINEQYNSIIKIKQEINKMNKQNKKIAQEKRRIEREKAEKKAKVVNLLNVNRLYLRIYRCGRRNDDAFDFDLRAGL